MSIVRNRELSQFGSFIYIDDPTQAVGIATEPTPYIGIGTANPTYKLHVVGNTNIDGDLTVVNGTIDAPSFSINGFPLVDAAILQWEYATNGIDMYRLVGSVGIGTSVFAEKFTVLGNVSAGQFISTVTSGTAPFVVNSDTQVTYLNASLLAGKSAPNGNIVGTTDTQTLTNKSLTSPSLTTPSVSSGGITFSGSTSGTTILRASAAASGTLTLPATTDTLVARNTSDTLTNKTIAAGSNTITGLTNANLSGSAGITNTNLANSTISGVSLGGNLYNLTAGSFISYNSGTTYNGSTALTIGVSNVTTSNANPASTIVARDINGDFTAGKINVSYLTASQTVEAKDFNSTSDQNLKENIRTFNGGLSAINSLRGVNFDWKDTSKPSIGVIAQELEQILPELVTNGDVKTVNYNGLIGVLIEAVKELSAEVEELKTQLNK